MDLYAMNLTANFPIVKAGEMSDEAQACERPLLYESELPSSWSVWQGQYHPALVLQNQPGAAAALSLQGL